MMSSLIEVSRAISQPVKTKGRKIKRKRMQKVNKLKK